MSVENAFFAISIRATDGVDIEYALLVTIVPLQRATAMTDIENTFFAIVVCPQGPTTVGHGR